MSKNQGLQGEYEARVAADLRQNEGDRDRVLAQIDALQKELEILVQDREMLLSMQSAVGATKQSPSEPGEAQISEPEAHVTPHAKSAKVPGARRRTARKAVPTQGRAGRGRKTDAKSAVADAAHAAKAPAKATTKATATKATATKATATKATATKTVAEKPAKAATEKASTAKSATAKPAKTATAKTATPKAADTKAAAPKADKLVKVVENYLLKQGAPASAAEVATAISTPERAVTIMSVRTALEGLVRKSAALRSKQSRSVYYEAVPSATAVTAAAEAPQQSESVTQ
ncbi:hypothetical protein [Streptomyces sp. SPB162]|uniref:hypothetical protein n=1 Tax=Streptomyces sp. SPB162 TaxID=2940560 RepID=UPI0024067342|nr:hypothetical protein [Streptomyces sp. SPB162]